MSKKFAIFNKCHHGCIFTQLTGEALDAKIALITKDNDEETLIMSSR